MLVGLKVPASLSHSVTKTTGKLCPCLPSPWGGGLGRGGKAALQLEGCFHSGSEPGVSTHGNTGLLNSDSPRLAITWVGGDCGGR